MNRTIAPRPRHWRRLAVLLAAGALVVVSCGGDDDDAAATSDPTVGALGSDERCAANQEAGTITFITGFDFAADAGILDVVVADAEGYFEDLCLDVELQSGLAPANGTAVAAGTAQMGAAASFGEFVNYNLNGGADLVALGQYGHTSIEALVVPDDGSVRELTDIPGTVMGVKGDIPYSIQAMLAEAGVERGTYTELLLEGFDPVAHLALGIDVLPVYKSNEPALLDAEGIAFRTFDPLDYDVPSSFAVYFTSRSFYEDHPSAVEDFVRAGLRGFAHAAEQPEAAIDHAFAHIDAAGNPFFLARQHELARWLTERDIVVGQTPEGLPIGAMDTERLGAEVANLVTLGVYESDPDWEAMIVADLVPSLYDGDTLIWPS